MTASDQLDRMARDAAAGEARIFPCARPKWPGIAGCHRRRFHGAIDSCGVSVVGPWPLSRPPRSIRRTPGFRRNAESMACAGRGSRRQGRRDRQGRRRGRARTPSRARQAAAARARRAAARSGLAVPRALAARRHGIYDDEVPAAGIITGIGRVVGARMRRRRQRRDGQGRHLFSDDREEASARAGDRAARTVCPASTWSIPAAPTCRTRTRSFPTATISAASSTTRRSMSAARHSADRRRDGLLHGGRRLCAGDVGRERSSSRTRARSSSAGPPLVKAATGEVVSAEELGGADVHAARLGRGRSLCAEDDAARACASRARIVAQPQPAEGRSAGDRASREPRSTIAEELYGIVPTDPRKPYDVREVIARLVDGSEFDEFKPLYGTTLVCGFAHIYGYPVGIVANNGILFSEVGAEGRAFHRAVLPARHPAGLPAEHHRLHGRPQIRGRRHRQGRRQAGHRGRLRRGAEVHRHHRRQLRRRQLRHVRPRLWSALPVDVAERAHLRDGRRAGGQRAGHRSSATASKRRARAGAPRRRGLQGADPRAIRRRRAIPTMPARGCGTTASSTRPTARMVLGLALSAALNAPIEKTRFGVFRM